LNRIDLDWFTGVVDGCSHISSLDNHMISGGFGDFLLDSANKAGLLRDKCFVKLGLDDYPECGTPQEVLRYHGLDGASLASKIKEILSSQC
jgi:transketolase